MEYPTAAISPGGWSCCETVSDAFPNTTAGSGHNSTADDSVSPRMLRDTYRKVKTLRRGAQGVVYLATPRDLTTHADWVSSINPKGVVAVKRIFPIYVSPDMAAVGITDVTRREVGVLRYLRQREVHSMPNDALHLGSTESCSPFVALIDVVLAIKGKGDTITSSVNTNTSGTGELEEERDLGDSPCGPYGGGGATSPPPAGDEVCIVMEFCPMDLSSTDGLVGRCKMPILTATPYAAGTSGNQGKFNGGMGLNLGLGGDEDEDDDGCYMPKQADNSRRTLNLGLPPKVALSLGESSDDEDAIDFAAQFAANGVDDDDDSSDDDGTALQIKSTVTGPNTTTLTSQQVRVEDELLVRQAMVRLLMYQIVRGVYVLHQHNLLHRDIKGSNILLTTTTNFEEGEGHPRIRFADFGSARSCSAISGVPGNDVEDRGEVGGGGDDGSTVLTSAVTRTTLLYRSPETLMNTRSGGTEYSYPADMWAVGVVFAELLLSIVKPCYSSEFGTASQHHVRGGWGGMGAAGINAHYLFQVQSEMELIGAIYKLIGPPTSDTSFLHEEGVSSTIHQNHCTGNVADNEPQSLKSEAATLRIKFSKLTTSSGLHLLASLLCMNPMDRITAQEALSHPYFHEDADSAVGDTTAVKKASELLAKWCRDTTLSALA